MGRKPNFLFDLLSDNVDEAHRLLEKVNLLFMMCQICIKITQMQIYILKSLILFHSEYLNIVPFKSETPQ